MFTVVLSQSLCSVPQQSICPLYRLNCQLIRCWTNDFCFSEILSNTVNDDDENSVSIAQTECASCYGNDFYVTSILECAMHDNQYTNQDTTVYM